MTCAAPFNPEYSYLASNTFNGDGSTTTFTFTFDYLLREQFSASDYSTSSPDCHPNIVVLVDGTSVSYYMPSSYSVRLASAPAIGTNNVVIRRTSFLSERKVDYTGGTVITESNLDKDGNQAQYLIQELADRISDQQCTIENINNVNSYYYNSVNGTQTVFPLSYTYSNNTSQETSLLSANEVLVIFNGTIQQSRSTNYSMSMIGGICNVTFVSAPALNTNVEIRTIASGVSQRVNINNDDVTTAKIADHAVTFVKTNFDGAGVDDTFLCQRSGKATWDTIDYNDINGLQSFIRLNKVTDLTAPTSSFSMNSQKITTLATPTNSTDAATKGYVDGLISSGSGSQYWAKVNCTNSASVVSCPFAADFVEIIIDSSTRGGTLNNDNHTTINHSHIWAIADLSTPVIYNYHETGINTGVYFSVQITKTSNSYSIINYGWSVTNSISQSMFFKFHKNP